MRSHAALSSSRPPSTDCSASIECGGTFSDSSWGAFGGAFMGGYYRANSPASKDSKRRPGDKKSRGRFPGPCPCASLIPGDFFLLPGCAPNARLDVLAQHRHRHVDEDVGVQRNLHRMVADHLERAFRHAHLRL